MSLCLVFCLHLEFQALDMLLRLLSSGETFDDLELYEVERNFIREKLVKYGLIAQGMKL